MQHVYNIFYVPTPYALTTDREGPVYANWGDPKFAVKVCMSILVYIPVL